MATSDGGALGLSPQASCAAVLCYGSFTDPIVQMRKLRHRGKFFGQDHAAKRGVELRFEPGIFWLQSLRVCHYLGLPRNLLLRKGFYRHGQTE